MRRAIQTGLILSLVLLTGFSLSPADGRSKAAAKAETDAPDTGTEDPGCKECVKNAATLFARGDNEGALASLRAWQAKCNRNLQLHLLLNTVLLRTKNGQQEALKVARQACEIDPNSSLAHLQTAMTLLMVGQASEAVPEFEKVVSLDPTSYEAWQALAEAYGASGEREKEAEAKRKAGSLNPTAQASRTRLISSLDKAGNAGQARAEYKKLCQDEQLPGELFLSLGRDAITMGYFAEGLACLERFSANQKDGPALSEARWLKTVASYLEGSEGSQQFSKSIDNLKGGQKYSIRAIACSGLKEVDNGNYPEAQKLISEAGSKAPTDPAVLLAMGKLALAEGKYKECIEKMEDAIKAEPALAGARIFIAKASFKDGDLLEAMSQARECARVKDLAPRAQALELRAKLRDDGASREGLKELAAKVDGHYRQNPQDPELNVAVAYLDLNSKDWNGAREKFEKALTAYPACEDAMIGMARLAKQEANLGLAKELLTKAISIAPGDSEAKDLSNTLK